MSLTLHYSPISCAMVPYITLTEAGAAFEVAVVDFQRGGHMTPEFLRLNPKHKVPVLVIDDVALTENVAIQLWIARQFPAAHLMPMNPRDEFQAISILAWCASGIHPFLTPNVLPQRYCDLPDSADSVRRCAHKMLREQFGIAEVRLAGREWFFEHFTTADAYLFWTYRRATQFKVDLTEFASCAAHHTRMKQRPSVQKLLAFEAETLTKLGQPPAAN